MQTDVEHATRDELVAHIRFVEAARETVCKENEQLKARIAWFERQVFGAKSERVIPQDPRQATLFEAPEEPPAKSTSVKEYERNARKEPTNTDDSKAVRFDESVPVDEEVIFPREVEGLKDGAYEIIGEKVTERLVQIPTQYRVKRTIRKTIKLKDKQSIHTAPAPAAVIERSFADVTLLAGLITDKFQYHLPLYRQHQRMSAAGVHISRGHLTKLTHRTLELLEPIYYELLSSILQSEVLSMDETPIKAGRKSKGKMQTGYFWPIYGDKDEIAFPFSASRGEKLIREALSEFCGVLVTDGYKVYERFCEKMNSIEHAQCWVHARRKFIEAEKAEPELAGRALELIGALYANEEKSKNLNDEKKLSFRAEHSKPLVEQFFNWLAEAFEKQVLLPTSPFTKAANYALEREQALKVFLDYPNVPLDTNHVERQIRPVAVGRKNWLFCWTEVGARYAGIAQSFIASCRLQGIDPYTYFVDVLQRIDRHPAREVHLLTPRLWKENFAQDPLRSDVHGSRQ